MVKLKQQRKRLVGQGERLERLGGRARLGEAGRRAERGRGLADAPAHGGARLGGGDARFLGILGAPDLPHMHAAELGACGEAR